MSTRVNLILLILLTLTPFERFADNFHQLKINSCKVGFKSIITVKNKLHSFRGSGAFRVKNNPVSNKKILRLSCDLLEFKRNRQKNSRRRPQLQG